MYRFKVDFNSLEYVPIFRDLQLEDIPINKFLSFEKAFLPTCTPQVFIRWGRTTTNATLVFGAGFGFKFFFIQNKKYAILILRSRPDGNR